MQKKYLHSKADQREQFKDFFNQNLMNENSYLRSQILSLTPYNEKLSLECAILRT